MEKGKNEYSGRILKQPKLDSSDIESNPILNKLIKKMNNESFMMEEEDVFLRLEEYKKKKNNI
jgi:hypothetical protein